MKAGVGESEPFRLSSSSSKQPTNTNCRCRGFRDTAFSENHARTLHWGVPWIAGFFGSFVAGAGMTLIEALKHGCDAVGFEISPYAPSA